MRLTFSWDETTAGRTQGMEGLEPRYYQMSEVVGSPLPAAVSEWVTRARALGVAAAVSQGSIDPVAELDDFDSLAEGWWHRVVAAGPRPTFAMPSPYSEDDMRDDLPLVRALDDRDATGDIDRYEQDLYAIVESEPRDVDAFAHLGHLYLQIASGRGEVVVTPALPVRQRRALTRRALECYESGVAVGELALPDPFTGVLLWSELDNRPFLRAMHGLALSVWHLGRFDAVELLLLNLLWLNPLDNQGARVLLPDVLAGLRPQDAEDR